jgi:hypothetical protein
MPARKEFTDADKKETTTKTDEVPTALSTGNPGILAKIKEMRSASTTTEN